MGEERQKLRDRDSVAEANQTGKDRQAETNQTGKDRQADRHIHTDRQTEGKGRERKREGGRERGGKRKDG